MVTSWYQTSLPLEIRAEEQAQGTMAIATLSLPLGHPLDFPGHPQLIFARY